MLPTGSTPGKKRLDLLIATHRHEDHIKGFDPAYFKNIEIKNIWMTAMMNPDHVQAERSLALDKKATQLMRAIERSRIALSPELQNLVSLYSISNENAEKALRETLPEQNNIRPKYVIAGQTDTDLGLNLQETQITVLGPENDIDRFYLGEDADRRLLGLEQFETTFKPKATSVERQPPKNISSTDFRQLQSRMLSDAFAFADESGHVINNSSVILLIEWRNRRLLFVGDAEWSGDFKEGKRNGAWNVMWNERRDFLNEPLDFLKIGHHGSENATPLIEPATDDHEVNQILNSILPLPSNGALPNAQAIVSTERSNYISIPRCEMLVELGKRIRNKRNYKEALTKEMKNRIKNANKEAAFLDKPQPLRTDFEFLLTKKDYVDIEVEPGD